MSSEMRECPFCGNQPRSGWQGTGVPGMDDCGYWGIDCCNAFAHADTQAEALAQWNRRALLARTEAGADGLCAKHGAMWAKGCAACDRDLDQMPGPPDASPVADGAAMLVRDVCEMAPADPDAPDTVCIRVSDLTRIAERYTHPQDASGDAEKDAEIARLNAIINSPQSDDFLRAVSTEAEHQRQRWGSDHDAGKAPADWFWLVGYLGGKALHSHATGDTAKAEHHIITTAAACANWHRAMFGRTDMRPGIDGQAAMQAKEAK